MANNQPKDQQNAAPKTGAQIAKDSLNDPKTQVLTERSIPKGR